MQESCQLSVSLYFNRLETPLNHGTSEVVKYSDGFTGESGGSSVVAAVEARVKKVAAGTCRLIVGLPTARSVLGFVGGKKSAGRRRAAGRE